MISPTIHFPGNCNEAIAYYEKVFKVTEKRVNFYRDAPPNSGMTITEDMLDLVMHASIIICGTKFNCSDTQEKVVAGNMILFNVFMEVIEKYDVDGIHLDYIRFPSTNYSYDSTSVARFKQETGLTSPYQDPSRWAQWRRDQVTNFVYKVYDGAMSRKPWIGSRRARVGTPHVGARIAGQGKPELLGRDPLAQRRRHSGHSPLKGAVQSGADVRVPGPNLASGGHPGANLAR